MRVLEAPWYRRRQLPKAVGTRGVLAKTPPTTFDKIFDKPQPPRVQWTQILAACLLCCAYAPDFYGVCRLIMRLLAARAGSISALREMPAASDAWQNAVTFSSGFSDQAWREIAASRVLARLWWRGPDPTSRNICGVSAACAMNIARRHRMQS